MPQSGLDHGGLPKAPDPALVPAPRSAQLTPWATFPALPVPWDAIAACRAVTERHAKTFSLAAWLLPRELRAACYAVYAFCRRADDAVDTASSLPEARAALELSRTRLARAFAGQAGDDLELRALFWAAARHGILRAPLDDLLDGMALDLVPLRLRTSAELLRYCDLAAGTVGRALAPALGAPPEATVAATALGVAMQLTNILRDVDEDLGLGRIYLADEELRAFGLSHVDVEQRHLSVAFISSQIARARGFYARAAPGVRAIGSWRARLCVRAMGVLYREILAQLERQGQDPFRGRARVSAGRKLWLVLTCLFGRGLG